MLSLIVMILMLIRRGTAEVVMAAVRAARKPRPQPICATCALAHIQRTARGKSMISCSFGGSLRPMRVVVLSCTGYTDRAGTASAKRIGFRSKIANHEGQVKIVATR
jgi:hypothetical protein